MPNSNEGRALRRVVFTAAEPGVELLLFDGQFHPVEGGQGVQTLRLTLPVGLYVLRARTGNAIADETLQVTAGDEPQEVRVASPQFRSPLPIPGTEASERHVEMAVIVEGLGLLKRRHLGTGGQLFLLGWDEGRTEGHTRPDPLSQLTLITPDGQTIALSEWAQVKTTASGARYARLGLDLAPGTYLLRLGSGNDNGPGLAGTLVVSPGWATMLIARVTDAVPSDWKAGCRLDLPNAAIHMVAIGAFSKLTTTDLRLVELARQGMMRQRIVMTESDLHSGLLGGKFHNPMLGIYGAYQLLLSPQPDQKLLKTVVANLLELLGPEHPDVTALDLRVNGLGARPSDFHFWLPPMLRSSFTTILELSASRESLVPTDSPLADAASLLLPGGEYLVWRAQSLRELGFMQLPVSFIKWEGQPLQDVTKNMIATVRMLDEHSLDAQRFKHFRALLAEPREPHLDHHPGRDPDPDPPHRTPTSLTEPPRTLSQLKAEILSSWQKVCEKANRRAALLGRIDGMDDFETALLHALQEPGPHGAPLSVGETAAIARRLGMPSSRLQKIAISLRNKLAAEMSHSAGRRGGS